VLLTRHRDDAPDAPPETGQQLRAVDVTTIVTMR
jgi:hypothetical protein